MSKTTTLTCQDCGIRLYWTSTPEKPLCGDCNNKRRLADIMIHAAITRAWEDKFWREQIIRRIAHKDDD